MTYNFKLFDGTTNLTTIEPLESDGDSAQSVPRRILDVTFSPSAFVVADDVTARFIAGFSFDVLDGSFAGTHTVDVGGSSYDPITNRTTIPVTAALTSSPMVIVNVETGSNGTWVIQGAANGEYVYYPNATFTVTSNGAGDGLYTVGSTDTSGSYPLTAVNVGLNTWSIAGDHTAFFKNGYSFVVTGNTPGAGTYTVLSSSLVGGATEIIVNESIPVGATNAGMITLSPSITRITVNGTIAAGAGTTGLASVPVSVAYPFAAPPTALTSLGSGQYSIIWHITGDHAAKFVVGSYVLIQNNNQHSRTVMTVQSASYDGIGVTSIVAIFRSDTTPIAPDNSGTLTFPLPPNPYGAIQYDIGQSSPLMLVGRGVTAFNNQITWGQALQQNDIYNAENFRTDDGTPPTAPLMGQLWYDDNGTTNNLMAYVRPTSGDVYAWHGVVTTDMPAFGDVDMGGNDIHNVGISSADAGVYPPADDSVVTSISYSDARYVNATDVNGDSMVGPLSMPSGTVTAPTLTFTGDTNTGIYSSAADTVDVAVGGANVLSATTTEIETTVPVVVPLGLVTAPTLTFAGDTNTGIYSSAADTVDVTTNGVNRLSIGTVGITSTLPIDMSNNKITNLLDPDVATDAANKAYVDSLTSGIVWIEAVQDPNLFDDTLGGPDVGSSADLADPYAAYHRSFIVKPSAYTIVGVNAGTSTWTISGNHDTVILTSETFVVDGNAEPTADSTYTVVSATNNGANTDIVVSEVIPVGATASGTVYHARGDWNGLDGHVVVYKPTTSSWVSVLTNTTTDQPRPVQAGDRFGVFMVPDNDDPLTTMPGGNLTGDAGLIVVVDSVSSPDYTVTWSASPYTPLEPDAVSVLGTNSVHFGKSYTFRGTWGSGTFGIDYKWIQFAGPSMIVDGVGLVYTGNILNLDTTYTDTLYVKSSDTNVAAGEIAVGDGTGLSSYADLTFDSTDGTLYVNSTTKYSTPGFVALEAPSVASGEAVPGFGGDAWLFGGWAAADLGGTGGGVEIAGGASQFVGTGTSTAWGGSVFVYGGKADATESIGGKVEVVAGDVPAVTGQPLEAGTVTITGGGIVNPGDASIVNVVGDVIIEGGVSSGTGAASTYNGGIDIVTSSTSRLKITADGEWEVGGNGGTLDQILVSGGTGAAPSWKTNLQSFILQSDDETTPLVVGTPITFRTPYDFVLTKIKASLTTAQATDGAGGIFTVDVKANGVSVFTTLLTIDNTSKTSATATTPAVLDPLQTTLTDDDEITVEITQVGDGTAAGLKVYMIGSAVL